MTHRIKTTAELETVHIFYGHILDEIAGIEQITRSRIERVSFQRHRVSRALIGTGSVVLPLDSAPVEIAEEEYELYDTLQNGLPYSTEGDPYTFLWRVASKREPFFENAGTYYVVLRFHARSGEEPESLTFEVTVT